MKPIFTLLFCALVFPCLTLRAVAAERPYEMSNAGRNVNPNPPLINFENITGWTVETVESEAKWERSAEQRIWGEGVGKLTYKNVQSEQRKTPVITLKAPQPVAIPMPFDCVDLWLYGNNWAWESDNSTPRVRVDALLRAGDVSPLNIVKVHLETVRWKEWFLIHRKLSPEQIKLLGDKPVFVGFEIHGGGNKDFRTLYFGDLSFYKEELKPLTYEPRPQRPITLPKGQTTGTNTGANTNTGKLPFPNREETLLPTNVCKEFKNSVDKKDETVSLEYNGTDGKLV
ncbi:MAG: hypothetical protein LBN39_00875, partial [Planctomycetaceae bacterium]|nr:hypothetical protein [Planctomycetaceae bacterium]